MKTLWKPGVRRWFGALIGLGLAGRVALVVAGQGHVPFYDERDYDSIATSLLSGHGFSIGGAPTAFRAPGQPLFLALVYAMVGHRPFIAQIVQAMLVVPVPLIALRLVRLLKSPTNGRADGASGLPVAEVLAASIALHPGLAYAAATLYPVSLTALALTLGVWLAAVSIQDGSRARAAAGGAALGVAGACVTYLAPLPLFAAVVALTRRRFAVAALLAAVGLAPAAAWTARNSAALGTAQLTTNGGFNLALGAQDRATPRSGNWIDPDVAGIALPSGEVERDRAYREIGVRWIQGHTLRYAALALARAVVVLDSIGRPKTTGAHASPWAALLGWLISPLVALGLVGLLLFRREPAAQISAAALGLVLATSALTIAKPRFRFPCDPLLWTFGGVAAQTLVHRRRRPVAAPEPGRMGTSVGHGTL